MDVFWTEPPANGVFRVPVAGGAAVTVATNQTAARGIAVDAVNVYWAANTAGTVSFLSKSTPAAAPAVNASGMSMPSEVALDPTDVYWTEQHPAGNVSRAAQMAGATPQVVASAQPNPTCLTVDATSVYWIAGGLWKAVK